MTNQTMKQAVELLMSALDEDKQTELFARVETLEHRIDELEFCPQKEILRQKEVFDLFGIGYKTLKKWVANGLKEYRLDNRVYYRRSELMAFFSNKAV